MIILWSQRANKDIIELRDYIAQDSPFYAHQFIERLIKRIDNLVDFPNMGRLVPEASREDIRELIHQGYRILYRFNENQASIVLISILHSSRNLSDMEDKPWSDN